MHQIYKEPENSILCPECGSKNVLIDEENEVTNNKKEKLKQYHCKDCKCMFIPAALIKSENNDVMNSWSKKMRMSEGYNKNKSWKDEERQYIIIKKKIK
jgi:transcription elongation factor Elf1